MDCVISRRGVLATAGGATAVLSLPGAAVSGQHCADPLKPITQPPDPTPEALIDRAFRMRRIALDLGDQPFGAVVVRDGRIIGQSWSRVVIDEDPTAHAEMAAVRDASRRLGSRDLGGAVLYSSSRPCPMCEAAAYWAGIERMVFGRIGADAGRPQLCR